MTASGVPNTFGTGLQATQAVRFGASPLSASLASGAIGVGGLINSLTSTPQASLGAQIRPNFYYSPTTVATGGIGFRPLSAGQTIVTVTASGYQQMSGNGLVTVNVQ